MERLRAVEEDILNYAKTVKAAAGLIPAYLEARDFSSVRNMCVIFREYARTIAGTLEELEEK